MGMFDWVNVQIKCPKCGNTVKDFQTKDSSCGLEIIDPTYITNFYSPCRHCNNWIEFSRNPATLQGHRPTPFSIEEIENMGFRITSGAPELDD